MAPVCKIHDLQQRFMPSPKESACYRPSAHQTRVTTVTDIPNDKVWHRYVGVCPSAPVKVVQQDPSWEAADEHR